MKVLKSQITDIEHLSKTRASYDNEVSFAGRGLKLNTRDDVKEINAVIQKSPNMKVLRLEGNTVAPEAAEELAKALKETKSLERFIANDLFTGRLKDEIPLALRSMCGAIDFSGAKLVEINMSDNAFGPIGLDALMEFFQAGCCHSLRELRLHNNGLGPQGAQKLALSLEQGWRKSGQKMALKTFVCGRNRLEYEGCKAISNTLKLIGTLEEIQMPQNGIRPNAIEFIADACACNPNLRTINMNDNTFRSVGAEWMAKALSKCTNLEYINFGDCLLKSRGALVLARALVLSPDIKEIIMSFNEISLDNGLEIARLFADKMKKLELLDLNGNKFGEDGVMDVLRILEPIGEAVSTLSEDEGEDDEEEEESEAGDEEDSGDEEEVNEDEYDDLEDYEEYDDDEYDDEGQEDEEEYDQEEECDEKYGSSNIMQQQTLFKPFNNNNGAQATNKPNLFSAMVVNRALKTNSVPAFDNFVNSPDMNTLKQLDSQSLTCVTLLDQFDAKFLIRFLNVLSRVYESSTRDLVLSCARTLIQAFSQKPSNLVTFSDEFLTQFGFLKSEEKGFHPLEVTEKMVQLFSNIFKENYFPNNVKRNIFTYVKLRFETANGKSKDPKFASSCQLLIKSFA